MSGSKFYVAWVISRFIIITGMISIATSTILWIGAVRGITAYSKYISHDDDFSVLLQSLLIGLFIIGCGYLLIYLRKKSFNTNITPANNEATEIKKELVAIDFRNALGEIGGLITIGGIIWLIFFPIISINAQNHSRFCDAYPNNPNCYSDFIGGGGADRNSLHEFEQAPIFPPILFGLILLPLFFIGQILVLLPHVRFRKRRSGHT